MPQSVLPSVWKSHRCGDMLAVYSRSPGGVIDFSLLPVNGPKIAVPRETLQGSLEFDLLKPETYPPSYASESLIQIKLAGSPYSGGFVAGATLASSPDSLSLKLSGQSKKRSKWGFTVTTRFSCQACPGLLLEHLLSYRNGEAAVRLSTKITNLGKKSVSLDLLSSFALGNITPYHHDFAPGRLFLHRFRSWWSAEGRHECRGLEDLGLERSWANWGRRVEKFGQIGSMPVRCFFPRAVLEDRKAGVFWGVQLAHPGSWQIEVTRCDDRVQMIGGQADHDYGHWRKAILPGGTWTTPEAHLTVTRDTFDNTCQRLTSMQVSPLKLHGSRTETSLPLICNDWCTNWGDTTHDKMIAMAKRLRGTGIKYLVIDDGWQKREGKAGQHIGDWDIDPCRFRSLKATCDAIRAEGLIPGIWFEFENISPGNRVWEGETAHQLHRDGIPLQVGQKRFWDFRDPWVHRYLRQKVIRLLKDNGIGYIKIDYNETIGVGIDGAESLGEGLRAHLEGVQEFFRSIRREVPGIVIENCSSGGHRLEPSMMALGDMASFSDAHECPEIPIIGLNVLRLIPARMSQLWAVLHREDNNRRLVYSLAAGFLGRLCLSGEIASLTKEQMDIVQGALNLYRKTAAPVIRGGVWTLNEHHNGLYRQPKGWQSAVCHLKGKKHCMVVLHTFGKPPASGSIALPPGKWRLDQSLQESKDGSRIRIGKNILSWEKAPAFSGKVLILKG